MKYLILILLFSFGCSSAVKKDRDRPKESTDLKFVVAQYHQNMRWGLWEKASLYMVESSRQEFVGRFEELGEDYKITDLEIKQVTLGPEISTVEVKQQWYHEPNMTLQKDRFIEEWEMTDEGWRLRERLTKKEFRKRKKEKEDQEEKALESDPKSDPVSLDPESALKPTEQTSKEAEDRAP